MAEENDQILETCFSLTSLISPGVYMKRVIEVTFKVVEEEVQSKCNLSGLALKMSSNGVKVEARRAATREVQSAKSKV